MKRKAIHLPSLLIVSLLEDGSIFNRHNPLYSNTAIIEVRPKDFISTSALDVVAFIPEKIEQWMKQGYRDAKRCIGDTFFALNSLSQHEYAKLKVTKAIDELDNDGFYIA